MSWCSVTARDADAQSARGALRQDHFTLAVGGEQLKQRQSRFRSNFDRVCGDKALQKMRMRSMSFQEPIKEVNEEYAAAHEILDRSFHTFRLKKAKPIRSVKSVYSAEPIEEEDLKWDSY